VSVSYATANGSATAGSDYLAVSGSLTWTAAQSGAKSISVPIIGDTTFEGNETFAVNISSVSAEVVDNQAVGTITNDDTLPPSGAFSVDDETFLEGHTGRGIFVTIRLPGGAPSGGASVAWSTADETATAPDYLQAQGTAFFSTGQTARSVSVQVHGETMFEPDETFTVNLSDPSGASISDGQGVVTLLNDDFQPTVSAGNLTGSEGSNHFVPLILSNPSYQPVTVDFATADGTAVAGSDYQATSGTVTIPAGQTVENTPAISTIHDTTYEPDETYFVDIKNPVNATVGDGRGTGTILNNDPVPTISVNDVTSPEGDAGTTPFEFTLSLSNPSHQAIGVAYATADGTANAPDDYVSASGTLTFQPGVTAKHVLVQVTGNAFVEPDETFNLSLSAPVNATISDATATGTIQNDDSQEFSVSDASVTEGDEGTANATFTVSLRTPATSALSVQYATATDTATSADFQARSGTVTFAAGQSSKTITVAVKSDLIDEPTETFFVNLSNPSNADIADGTGEGTITDNDPTPGLSIGDVTLVEGNSGTTTQAVFQLSLSNPSSQYVSVDYDTDNRTATAPGDYKARTGTKVFQPGQTTKTITVPVIGDNTQESNETFTVSLLDPDNAEIVDGEGLGTITDNDSPTISIADVSKTEVDTGATVAYAFKVTLSKAATGTITVQYATADGTAVAPGDYTAKSGTLTFTAGQVSKSISVVVKGDTAVEPNETFFVNLSNPTGAAISDGQGVGTIVNDD
jgi:hypothetical protein